MKSDDIRYMTIALQQAKKGLGYTSPNPMVGAVIVKDSSVIATGYHHRVGDKHAEIDALDKIDPAETKNAVLYVTLEPCSHHGRTPPCALAISKTGINRVVIATLDPDPRVSGRGVQLLKENGIEVSVGTCHKEAKDLNSIYYFWKSNKRPYIVLKAAMTLDGKIGAYTGSSKWISNSSSRKIVHRLRRRLKAIAVGAGTVRVDKPRLDCRLDGCENKPVDRLVFSRSGDKSLLDGFKTKAGNSYLVGREQSSSPEQFFEFCNEHEIDSVLVEGGSSIYTWFLNNNIVDRLLLFYKPAFLGSDANGIYGPGAVPSIDLLNEFSIFDSKRIENNLLLDCGRGEALCLLDT
jgi:diaminohydroxyphosphoribosylaminopyrimidine deaminase/5-amino-6-(5-phosphoribosylamino)uracil reductase